MAEHCMKCINYPVAAMQTHSGILLDTFICQSPSVISCGSLQFLWPQHSKHASGWDCMYSIWHVARLQEWLTIQLQCSRVGLAAMHAPYTCTGTVSLTGSSTSTSFCKTCMKTKWQLGTCKCNTNAPLLPFTGKTARKSHVPFMGPDNVA